MTIANAIALVFVAFISAGGVIFSQWLNSKREEKRTSDDRVHNFKLQQRDERKTAYFETLLALDDWYSLSLNFRTADALPFSVYQDKLDDLDTRMSKLMAKLKLIAPDEVVEVVYEFVDATLDCSKLAFGRDKYTDTEWDENYEPLHLELEKLQDLSILKMKENLNLLGK